MSIPTTEPAAASPTRIAAIESPRNRLSLRLALLIVAAYAAVIYLPFLDGASRTLTRHEVLITAPALSVLETGAWVIPRYLGKPWVDKPPLITWVTAGVFAIAGGFNEVAARLPAALSAIALSLLVTVLAARFYGTTAGLLAGLAQASTVYMYMQGRLGEIDMPFALLIAVANAALAWHWGRGQQRLSPAAIWTFHIAAGLAVLAKGPLGAILPGASVFCFCTFQRSLWPLKTVLLTPAILASVTLALSWHVAVVVLWPPGFERLMYTYFSRAAGMHHLGSQNPLLYFYTIPWLVLPWSIVLVIGWKRMRDDAWPRDAWLARFLWAWFFGGLAVLTLTAFKHKHYCIPILPPLSIFCGHLLAVHLEKKGRQARDFYIGAFATLAIVFGIVSGYIMPKRDYRRETAEFVREATASVPRGERLFVVGLAQSAVYAYLSRPVEYADTPEELRTAVSAAGGPLWVMTTRGNLAAGEGAGLSFEEVRGERERRKVERNETLALGRVRLTREQQSVSAPASAP